MRVLVIGTRGRVGQASGPTRLKRRVRPLCLSSWIGNDNAKAKFNWRASHNLEIPFGSVWTYSAEGAEKSPVPGLKKAAASMAASAAQQAHL